MDPQNFKHIQSAITFPSSKRKHSSHQTLVKFTRWLCKVKHLVLPFLSRRLMSFKVKCLLYSMPFVDYVIFELPFLKWLFRVVVPKMLCLISVHKSPG